MKNIKNTEILTKKHFKLAERPKLFLPNNIIEQIRYLHQHVGKVEWSGLLLVNINGTLNNLTDLEVTVDNIFPCDIGTTGYTTYDFADNYEECVEVFPEYSLENGAERWNGLTQTNGWKISQLHTHHTMDTFFSGTDTADLERNANTHGLYISLIVNMDGRYMAKGAFTAKAEAQTQLKSEYFNLAFNDVKSEEALLVFEFDIVTEVEDWFIERVNVLKDRQRAEELAAAEARKNLPTTTGFVYSKDNAAPGNTVSLHQSTLKKIKSWDKKVKNLHLNQQTILEDAGFQYVVRENKFYFQDSFGNWYDDDVVILPEWHKKRLNLPK